MLLLDRFARDEFGHAGGRRAFGREVLTALRPYPWPGNVSENPTRPASTSATSPPTSRRRSSYVRTVSTFECLLKLRTFRTSPPSSSSAAVIAL